MKKLYTILVLLKNVIFRKKHYTLHFVADTSQPPLKRWYYDFKCWGFNHDSLEMMGGADSLCELYANGKDETTVEIIATNKLIDDKLTSTLDLYEAQPQPKDFSLVDKIIYGRTYKEKTNNKEEKMFWICPVTLFVLGR